MSERSRRLQFNFDNPGAPVNQRSAKFTRERFERNPDRFGKPRNKSEKAESKKAIRDAIENTEEFQLKRALGKISAGTETPEDRAFVLRHAGIVPTNGLNGDSEIFNISDLKPQGRVFEQ